MIKEITEEQQAKFSEYVEKYTAIGLNTDRIDRPKGVENVTRFCVHVLERPKPKAVVFCESIKQLWEHLCLYVINKKYTLEPKPITRSQKKILKENKIDFVSSYLNGCYDSYWFAFYDFFHNECGINYDEKYEMYKSLLDLSFIYPLEEVVFVSEKPVEINIQDKKLHADMKPALVYSDGFGLYRLNGVRVPKWLVMTSSEDLTLEHWKKIKNVEVNTQFIRKFGVDRMRNEGKVIESLKGASPYNYELIDMSPIFKHISYAPHLWMDNPSTDEKHFEPVNPGCKNIQEAINSRAGNIEIDWNPVQLS